MSDPMVLSTTGNVIEEAALRKFWSGKPAMVRLSCRPATM